jgi:ribosomal protein S18 acetylase RimI-like enzyme
MGEEHPLRRATPADAAVATRLLHEMMRELAALGPDALNAEPERIADLSRAVDEHLATEERLIVIAGAERGLLMARTEELRGTYAPKRLLHVSAVWVDPAARRRGLGRRLLEEALAWGRWRGCVEARLNVLAGNPASALYRALAFEDVQTEMRRLL